MLSSFMEYREKSEKQDELIIETNSEAQEKNLQYQAQKVIIKTIQ